jgi:hypothetical protein
MTNHTKLSRLEAYLDDAVATSIFPPMLVPSGFQSDLGLGAGEITFFNPNTPNAVPRALNTQSPNVHQLITFAIEKTEKKIEQQTDRALFAPLAGVDRVQDMKATVANILTSYAARVSSPQYSRLVSEFLEPVVRKTIVGLNKHSRLEVEYVNEYGVSFITPFQIALNHNKKEVLENFLNAFIPLAQIDPSVLGVFKPAEAAYDLGRSLGISASWLRSPQEYAKLQAEQQQQQAAMAQQQQALDTSQVLLNSAKAQQISSGV